MDVKVNKTINSTELSQMILASYQQTNIGSPLRRQNDCGHVLLTVKQSQSERPILLADCIAGEKETLTDKPVLAKVVPKTVRL